MIETAPFTAVFFMRTGRQGDFSGRAAAALGAGG